MANHLGRRPLIAGNWKMNTDPVEGLKLAEALTDSVKDAEVEVVICPPFTHLTTIQEVIYDSNIKLGAQNMFWEENGAFTGEISPLMLKAIGCQYVIIGHSERRQLFGETDKNVNKKVLAAINHQLNPIIAVGETLEEREQNKTEEKIKNQIIGALEEVKDLEIQMSGDTPASRGISRSSIIFAYEPIWAIGTGKTATPEQANDIIRFIRALLGSLYSPEKAKETRILYGGSVTPDNIDSLMAEPNIDGALVGGASLKADSFARIVNFK